MQQSLCQQHCVYPTIVVFGLNYIKMSILFDRSTFKLATHFLKRISRGNLMSLYFFIFFLFNFATRAGSPQQREPITVAPNYLPTLSTFPVGGNRSTRRKPTTFGRALTILFSHEDWVRVHIKMNFTGDRARNLMQR